MAWDDEGADYKSAAAETVKDALRALVDQAWPSDFSVRNRPEKE